MKKKIKAVLWRQTAEKESQGSALIGSILSKVVKLNFTTQLSEMLGDTVFLTHLQRGSAKYFVNYTHFWSNCLKNIFSTSLSYSLKSRE